MFEIVSNAPFFKKEKNFILIPVLVSCIIMRELIHFTPHTDIYTYTANCV